MTTQVEIIIDDQLSSNKINTRLRWNNIKNTITSHNNEFILYDKHSQQIHHAFDTLYIYLELMLSSCPILDTTHFKYLKLRLPIILFLRLILNITKRTSNLHDSHNSIIIDSSVYQPTTSPTLPLPQSLLPL